MGTLTALMGIASTALQAEQAALNATSNNVANQNTVGYTREVVVFQSQDTVSLNGTTSADGVSTGNGAVSVRDRILEQRVQQQTQVEAQSSAVSTALAAVQSVFQLSATSTSAAATTLGTAINALYNSFTALAANPSDAATRQAVLTAATTLTNAFNTASTQLTSITTSLNGEVTDTVGQVNSLTASIAILNQQITSASPSGDAGVLEDQRQAAIAQLSQLIGLDQITTPENGISLTTSSGAVLVSAGQSYALTTSQVAGATQVLAGPDAVNVTATITGGSLGGVLQSIGQVSTFSSDLDSLAYAIGTQVNTQNAAGLDGTGAAGAALFTVPTSSVGAAGTIKVATSNPASIAAASVGEGTTGNTNATALAGRSTGTVVNGQTASSYFASFLAQVGNAVSSATSDTTVQQAALTQLTTLRDATSGVSLDQEAANLTRYQRSYEAAAKVFSIVDQLFADVLNLGVSSAVS